MTEADWLGCYDPAALAKLYQDRTTDRKSRLFSCACCRVFWPFLTDIRSREAVEAAERFVDGHARAAELRKAAGRASNVFDFRFSQRKRLAMLTTSVPAVALAQAALLIGNDSAALLLRDIFGNTFRPARVDPSWLRWNDGTVPKIAQAIYEQRAFDRLPILHDALLDAGCDDEDILAHCRGEGPHVRGCWVIDLILGKQ